jgi:hydrogenase nickel incorporation protein HypB
MSVSDERAIAIEEDILGRNNAIAADNRAIFRQKKILALNLVSSPGSGKTELLTATIMAAKDKMTMVVIEGDQQTSNDADRIRVTGASAYQINTGKGCHLDANMVRSALEHISIEDGSILFIENVGNLVCPAEFDLGEAHKVAILSVTEGEDKPLKYPDMFRAADVMIINKIDLLPYLRFDIDRCEAYARQVNPNIRILRTSATTKEGLDGWVKWLTVESALCNLV